MVKEALKFPYGSSYRVADLLFQLCLGFHVGCIEAGLTCPQVLCTCGLSEWEKLLNLAINKLCWH